jgi:hypothetical protein
MTAKTDLIPDTKYSYPSNRNYYDDSTSTATAPKVFDASKRGADYGVTDPEVAVVKAPAV